ncbi:MAG: ATP-dependent Clp protease proteolytic subunit [candidate division WOR-3 bacterium]|nr:MAG: ATP-dependent Clp protease proteolytic subunit [candidate division WOR-3 bacterium]
MIFTPQFAAKKKKEEAEEPEVEQEAVYYAQKKDEPPRLIGICGDLDEEKAGELLYGMISLYEAGATYQLADPTDENSDILASYAPFEFIISTLGGSAQEMFGLHDIMRVIRENCDIHTVGLGKVFSAGTLLLASGTKGKRRIGKNCRVMIHAVLGGNHGSIHNLENEMDEIRWVQERYIEAMVEETNMSKTHLKKILNRKVNAYFTAEEAVELGIADIIF